MRQLGIEEAMDGGGGGGGGSNLEFNPPDVNAEYGPATLVKNARNVGTIWQEWRYGVGGRKPARLFSEQERGKVTDAYGRRKPIYLLLSHLVRSGMLPATAIRKIELAYPGKSMGFIAQDIRYKQKKNLPLPGDLNV